MQEKRLRNNLSAVFSKTPPKIFLSSFLLPFLIEQEHIMACYCFMDIILIRFRL